MSKPIAVAAALLAVCFTFAPIARAADSSGEAMKKEDSMMKKDDAMKKDGMMKKDDAMKKDGMMNKDEMKN